MRGRSPVSESEKINGFWSEITCWPPWVWQHPAKCSISLENQLQAQQSQGKAWVPESEAEQISALLPRGSPWPGPRRLGYPQRLPAWGGGLGEGWRRDPAGSQHRGPGLRASPGGMRLQCQLWVQRPAASWKAVHGDHPPRALPAQPLVHRAGCGQRGEPAPSRNGSCSAHHRMKHETRRRRLHVATSETFQVPSGIPERQSCSTTMRGADAPAHRESRTRRFRT